MLPSPRTGRAFVAIVALGLLAAACGSSSKSASTDTPTSEGTTAVSSPTTTTDTPALDTAPATITIKNLMFSAATTVKAGTAVTVKNADDQTHTLTSDDGSSFDAGNIFPNASKAITAPTKPGDYPFHCNIHANMHGVLHVTA